LMKNNNESIWKKRIMGKKRVVININNLWEEAVKRRYYKNERNWKYVIRIFQGSSLLIFVFGDHIYMTLFL
jgi:hypothetical protein